MRTFAEMIWNYPNVTVERDSDGNSTQAGNESAPLSLRRVWGLLLTQDAC